MKNFVLVTLFVSLCVTNTALANVQLFNPNVAGSIGIEQMDDGSIKLVDMVPSGPERTAIVDRKAFMKASRQMASTRGLMSLSAIAAFASDWIGGKGLKVFSYVSIIPLAAVGIVADVITIPGHVFNASKIASLVRNQSDQSQIKVNQQLFYKLKSLIREKGEIAAKEPLEDQQA